MRIRRLKVLSRDGGSLPGLKDDNDYWNLRRERGKYEGRFCRCCDRVPVRRSYCGVLGIPCTPREYFHSHVGLTVYTRVSSTSWVESLERYLGGQGLWSERVGTGGETDSMRRREKSKSRTCL